MSVRARRMPTSRDSIVDDCAEREHQRARNGSFSQRGALPKPAEIKERGVVFTDPCRRRVTLALKEKMGVRGDKEKKGEVKDS